MALTNIESNNQNSTAVVLSQVILKKLNVSKKHKSVRVPFSSIKQHCVLVPSCLSRFTLPKALLPRASKIFRYQTEKRFFLLSINKVKESKVQHSGRTTKPKRTKNRKAISKSELLKHKGESYILNTKKSGIYPKIAHDMIEQLELCILKWKRVLVVRFDLHVKHYTGNNTQVSKFRKNLQRRLERKYQMLDIGFTWAREVEKAKSQHYHFALFLDGNNVRHSKKILEMVESTWKGVHHENHVPVIPKPYHFINSPESKAQAVYRISYLAKARGKGYRNPRANDYGTSRLARRVRLPMAETIKRKGTV